MNGESQLELSISEEHQDAKTEQLGVFTIDLKLPEGMTLRDLFKPFSIPWFPYRPFSALMAILEKVKKYCQQEENTQQVIRIKRESITFTPVCYISIREFSLSPILNN